MTFDAPNPGETFRANGNPLLTGNNRAKLNAMADICDFIAAREEAIVAKLAEPSEPPAPPLPGIRPCKLTMTGGNPGSPTVPCSYVYTVKSLTGATLKLGASPVWARPPKRKMLPATNGFYYFDVEGLQLATCDEVVDATPC